jgi:hypothetical protein
MQERKARSNQITIQRIAEQKAIVRKKSISVHHRL